MGAVYEALEPGTGRRVALKLLHETARDTESALRFEREGPAAALVNHANVARVHACKRDPKTGATFLVSELLEGGSLAARVKTGIAPREAASLGAQIARGLEAIH